LVDLLANDGLDDEALAEAEAEEEEAEIDRIARLLYEHCGILAFGLNKHCCLTNKHWVTQQNWA